MSREITNTTPKYTWKTVEISSKTKRCYTCVITASMKKTQRKH